MNARQTKKRGKVCFYLGVFESYLQQMQTCMENGIPLQEARFVIKPIMVGLGHNQHHFSHVVRHGKLIYKLAQKYA